MDCRCRRRCGVAATDGGFIDVDIQIRTNVQHIFAIGDNAGPANKAVHEAHAATEVIVGELQDYKSCQPLLSIPT